MALLQLKIKSHVETIDFILNQSKVDYSQLEKYEKEFNYTKMSLLSLYNHLKNIEYSKSDNKGQLIATPERLYKGDAPYKNCAVKVYLFVCILRYLKKKNHPLTKNKIKFYIEISGKEPKISSIGHIYIKTKLDKEIRYFDFTYPDRNQIFRPLYIPSISIAKEIKLED